MVVMGVVFEQVQKEESLRRSEASFHDVNEYMSRCKQARIGKKQEVVDDGKETHIQV